MECWFCDHPSEAQGQCTKDGRFICRAHSEMRDGVLVCCECAAGGQDKLLENLLKSFARLAESSKCPACGKGLLSDSLDDYAEFVALTAERKRIVAQKFSHAYHLCKSGCVVCIDCTPKEIKPTFLFHHNRQCPVCGKTYLRD